MELITLDHFAFQVGMFKAYLIIGTAAGGFFVSQIALYSGM